MYGPYNPSEGHRFNPNKLLLDPYAKSIARVPKWTDTLQGYKVGDERADLSFSETDSAGDAPLAIVIDEAFTWVMIARQKSPLTNLLFMRCM